jgi:tetratricopeptide (TPR) repeat protein
MPGLKQLQQFSEDIAKIGNEAAIRSQKNEPFIPYTPPAGISEADDSDEFLFGLPGHEEQPQDSDDMDLSNDELPADGEGEIDIDALLAEESGKQREDTSPDSDLFIDPDLAGFFEDEAAATPAPQETDEPSASADSPLPPDFDNLPPPDEAVPDDFNIDELIGKDAPREAQKSADADDSFEMPDFDQSVGASGDDFLPPDEDTIGGAEESADADDSFEMPDFDQNVDAPGDDFLPPDDLSENDETLDEAKESADADDSFEMPDFDQSVDAPGDDLGETPEGGGAESAAITDDFDDFDSGADQEIPLGEEGKSEAPEAADDFGQADFGGIDGLDDPFSGVESVSDDSGEGVGEDFGDDDADAQEATFDDFDIPGFSEADSSDAPVQRGSKSADFSKREKNTLTDHEYDLFQKHLALYPLNLRIAIEEIIVSNEFNDDVIFQVIQRVIKKAPARQIANQVQKITDKIISIPRDFERRTAQAYEIYKQSLEYQLKNRILPGALIMVILGLFGFLVFLFVRHAIYLPVKAESLYKEGQTLLLNDMYEQSEDKFNEALLYRQKKKWFYTFARGYREKKQYERAGNMYRQILSRFNHEKQAGIEYAQMELYDRANYERAEEIARREVLDYFINDSDGLLLLGDILLEWGTEEAPQKLEDAREIYSTLIQLYGSSNVYLGRMMRYFIRKDNLREVLSLKNTFYSQKNKMPLDAQDVIELSGYLMEKLFGPLLPSEEYMRTMIEDVRELLEMAVKAGPEIPESLYNYGRYFMNTRMFEQAKSVLEAALQSFEQAASQNHRRILKKINTYRLLGEIYFDEKNYLRAEELFNMGLEEFENEQRSSGLEGTSDVGALYGDMGNVEYFISGDMDEALRNYTKSIETKNDTPSIRYRIGFIQYGRHNYSEALGSFIKTADQKPDDTHILLALGNTLSLRNNNFAAESYYGRLLDILDLQRARLGVLLPQVRDDQHEIVDLYMKAANNLGVTLCRIAQQRGDSAKNAEGLVRLSESARAYDALTRNPVSMVRLEGSNLAQQNISYITYPRADYGPEIYTEIPRVLYGESTP